MKKCFGMRQRANVYLHSSEKEDFFFSILELICNNTKFLSKLQLQLDFWMYFHSYETVIYC